MNFLLSFLCVSRTRWHKNPYIRGAYSYRTAPFDNILLEPLGPTLNGKKVSDFSRDNFSILIFYFDVMKVPYMIFAGEAYDVNHHSTAHGAFASGRDQAMKIVEWKKNEANK